MKRNQLITLLFAILFLSCTPEQWQGLQAAQNCIENKQPHVWEDGVIPYAFREDVPDYHKELMWESIRRYEAVVPVTFEELSMDELFGLKHGVLVKYTGRNSVNSSFYPYGQGEYITDLRLGGEMFVDQQTMDHEIGHVLGLPHEHQRADRDKYIVIHWENIPEAWHGNYRISEIGFDTPYDPNSIMGYDDTAVSIDPSKPSVEMLDGRKIKPSGEITELDMEKLNELYCWL